MDGRQRQRDYTNPLLYDEFSDPDVLRVGEDYYLAGTTMHTVPGLVILHSRDLVNWENVSYCFDRFDFDDDAFSLKNGKEIYGQEFGLHASDITTANSISIQMSTGKDCSALSATRLKGHGSI